MQIEIISKIKEQLNSIKFRYQEQYGAVFFDVKIKELNDGVVLSGVVLSGRQKREAFLAVKDILKDQKINNEIKVLGDPNEKMEVGWGIIKGNISDIWGIFPGKNNYNGKLTAVCGGRERATQALKGDSVRILGEKGVYLLIQAQDATVGWAEKRLVSRDNYQTARRKWLAGNSQMAKAGSILKARLTNKIRHKFISFLERYLYVPYILGGATELGIDCSGMVQKFYWDIFRLSLPRHSRDQSGFGENTILKKAQFGDLVFSRDKIRKHPHVGIVVDKFNTPKDKCLISENILILNARREKGGVVIESAGEILKEYDLIAVKRLIKIKN